MPLKVLGVKATVKVLRAIDAAVEDAVEAKLEEQGDELIQLVSDRAPQLSGALINSAFNRPAGRFARKVGFGDLGAPAGPDGVPPSRYAILQHERVYTPGPITRAKLGTAAPGAGRKYLQRPYDANRARFLKEMAEAVARATALVVLRTRGRKAGNPRR